MLFYFLEKSRFFNKYCVCRFIWIFWKFELIVPTKLVFWTYIQNWSNSPAFRMQFKFISLFSVLLWFSHSWKLNNFRLKSPMFGGSSNPNFQKLDKTGLVKQTYYIVIKTLNLLVWLLLNALGLDICLWISIVFKEKEKSAGELIFSMQQNTDPRERALGV